VPNDLWPALANKASLGKQKSSPSGELCLASSSDHPLIPRTKSQMNLTRTASYQTWRANFVHSVALVTS